MRAVATLAALPDGSGLQPGKVAEPPVDLGEGVPVGGAGTAGYPGNGGTVLDPEVVAQLMARRRSDPMDRLTPREHEVLRLMAEGRSSAGIARALKVSHSATEKYISNIFAKLGLPPTGTDHRRVLAVLKFLRA